MLMFIAGLAWAGLLAWLLLRAIGQYGGYETITATEAAQDGPSKGVAVIIPARNEEQNIERCLSSLTAQDYPRSALRIIVVNDNSTDASADIVRRLAASDERVELLDGRPLPQGWAGKPFACWQGASSAAAQQADWLCFIDADTAAAPGLLRAAIAAAKNRAIDMLSLEPFQELGSFWERLIIPAGFLMLAFTQDLRRVNEPNLPDAAANGQFILIRRDVYQSVGGHAAVRDQICEDTALARAVKKRGHRLAVLGAESLIRTRMYRGLSSLWQGLSKNITEMIGGKAATILVALAAILLACASVLLPAWELFACLREPVTDLRITGLSLAFAGSLAMLGTHIGAARYLRIPKSYGLLFPLGYLLGAMIAFSAVRRRLRGEVKWKDRGLASSDNRRLAGDHSLGP